MARHSLSVQLHFTVVGVDSNSGEETGETYEEDYPLEVSEFHFVTAGHSPLATNPKTLLTLGAQNLELNTSDFIAKVSLGDFRMSWDSLGNDNEVLQKFSLQFKKLEDAVVAVIDFFGMQACDGTAVVKSNRERGKPHMLHLSGIFVGGVKVMVRAQIGQTDEGTVVLKIAVRSENDMVSQQVAEIVC